MMAESEKISQRLGDTKQCQISEVRYEFRRVIKYQGSALKILDGRQGCLPRSSVILVAGSPRLGLG